MITLLVASLFAPIGAAASTTSAGDSSSLVGVPSDQVGPADSAQAHAGPPDHAIENIPTDAAAWDVHASDHAGDLEVEIDADDSGVILRVSDEINHDGRTVAVDAGTLEDAVGHAPETAHGDHSEGDDWSSSIEYDGDRALIDVPHFSTNEISFDGEVNISATGASDGTSFEYELEDDSSVENVVANVTGSAVESENSLSEISEPDDVYSFESAGNSAPTGIEGDESPELTIQDMDSDAVTEDLIFEVPEESTASETFELDAPQDDIIRFYGAIKYEGNNYGSAGMTVYLEGEEIADLEGVTDYEWENEDGNSGDYEYEVDEGVGMDVSDKDTVELEIDAWSESWSDNDIGFHWGELQGDEPNSVSVSSDSDSESGLSVGDEASIDLERTDNIEFDSSDWTQVSWDLDYTAVAETTNPALNINGESVSYSGVLNDGETESLEVDKEWLEDGENEIIVETDSANGLETHTDVEFSHGASSITSVDYDGETWSERYNVTRTWDDATTDASVTIPFDSSRVVDIRDLELRVNGDAWESVDSYELDGTTLEVQLGDVSSGDEIAVRATGSKVDVSNGEIDVLEPTVEGDTLDSFVEIVDHSDEFSIDVGGTTEGDYLHRTTNESWSAASTESVFHATGEQELRAPGASSGSTARVQTFALEVSPNAGEVAISSADADGDEIQFDAEPDGATEVDYTWHDTNSGERYVLYSDTHGVVRDSATASSPVTLTGSSYEETLQIMTGDDGSGGDEVTTAGSGGPGAQVTEAVGISSPIMLIVVGVGLIVGMAVVASRTDVPTWVVGVGGALIGLISLEAISPGTISSGVGSTIVMIGSAIGDVWAEVGGALLLIGGMVGAYLVIRWWQTREERATEPDTEVTFDLGGRDD